MRNDSRRGNLTCGNASFGLKTILAAHPPLVAAEQWQ
jgi:hypothetical protein